MNRIYQGRVVGMELMDPKKDEVLKAYAPDEMNGLLWSHHELFQDAVNYHLICLLALASDRDSDLYKIRKRLDGEEPAHNVWGPFSRRGQKRRGMREVARYFGLDTETATVDDCCREALAGNEAAPEVLDLALKELIHFCGGDGQIQQEGRSMLPRFCKFDYMGGFNTGAIAEKKTAGEMRLRTELHALTTAKQWGQFAREIRIEWVVNISRRSKAKAGEDARNRLLAAVAHYGQYFGTHQAKTKPEARTRDYLKTREEFQTVLAHVEREIREMDAERLPEIPPNERSIPDRLEALILFKYFPCQELADLLKFLFPPPKSAVEKTGTKRKASAGTEFASLGDDAIKMARGERGYVYRGFTSMARFNPANTPEMTWFDFELEAYKEALKALNQIRQKGEERDSRRAELENELAYMLGRTEKYDGGEGELEAPPVVAGDPRIERLEKALEGLRQVYDMADDEVAEYGLHERTIRGYPTLAKKWNGLHPERMDSSEARKRLRDALTEYQTENRETVGSVMLFEKLIEPGNWIIWQEPDESTAKAWNDARFGKNPLAALLRKRETEEEIERLKEPIRLTPADPRHSPRQYCFGDRTSFNSKKGAYRHEANRLSVLSGLAIQDGGVWREQRVRLIYSAPRMLREGLRGEDEHLDSMPWLQPMMEGLGAGGELLQDMHSYAVFLMPRETREGEKASHLNFPVTLEPDMLVDRLGKKTRWAGQFAGGKDKNIYLRWPADEWSKSWKGGRWYEKGDLFRVLSVDLGQRDAGAFALLTCRPDAEIGVTAKGEKRFSRLMGEANGRSWFAAVEKSGLLRLPGEDALVLRGGQWEQELSGEKGRLATAEETRQAKDWASQLGCATLLDDSRPQRFFAEQNRMLLMALRRAQGRLARLHRWSWMLNDGKRCAGARAEMMEPGALSAALQALAQEGKWELVTMGLAREIEELKALIGKALVATANRVLPLKGRKWGWQARSDGAGYVMEQGERGSDSTPTRIAGQRGLSMERIELVEDLRKRCQSFNRALLRKTGERSKMGRAARGRELPDPCPEVLDKLDRLREQRVNQTAHLILAETLGVRLKSHEKSQDDRTKRDVHGEYEKAREPVDFVVLEDLSRYLSSQGRSRGENSRLMKWCHRAVLTKLKQLTETFGIPVLEVGAAYSSRFSARDGVPGFRAVEVGIKDLGRYPWKKALEKGEEEVVRLAEKLNEIGEGHPRHPRTLLAPIAGGPLFVPMSGPVEQADINAAINLGMRAVAAPDRLDIHMRIRTEKGKDGRVRPAIKSKRELARWGKKPPVFEMMGGEGIERCSNFFPIKGFDVAYEKAALARQDLPFASGKALWGTIKSRQWERIRGINDERIARNGWGDSLRM